MLSEPIAKRYRADGKENFELSPIQLVARDEIAQKLIQGDYKIEAVNCPLCGGTDSRCVSEKDTYGLPTRVVACAACGLVYNSPRLARDTLPTFYAEHYRELDRALPGVQAYFNLERTKGARIYGLLERHALLQHLRGKCVVEIGCGAGGVLAHFRQEGFEVLGCDLIPTHLEYGTKEMGLDLHYGDLRLLRTIIAERKLDIGLVIYEQVFEHLPDPRAELALLYEFLGSDALLYIGVPGLRNIDAQYNSDFLRFLQLPHLIHFDLDHLVALMRTSGFAIVKGNEVAQAVFVKSATAQAAPMPGYKATAVFLAGLEARRRRKALLVSLRASPRNLGRWAQASIEQSNLPKPVKDRARALLRGIKRLANPSRS